MLRVFFAVTVLIATSAPASAHTFLPGLMTVREHEDGRVDVDLRAPVAHDSDIPDLSLEPRFPAHCSGTPRPAGPFSLQCGSAGLVGTVVLEGFGEHKAAVMVQLIRADGRVSTHILRAGNDRFWISASGGRAPPATARVWIPLGFEHIAEGVDHLLFVLMLTLLIPGLRSLVAAVTAFTLAHSITLAGATLGGLSLPGPPVEAFIALSIALLAADYLRRPAAHAPAPPDAASAPARRPLWPAAFCFGLIHGFGFAGALTDLGLPERAAGWALLWFNLGVELGQLAFIALILLPILLLRRLRRGPRLLQLVAWCVGALAAAWTIERIAAW